METKGYNSFSIARAKELFLTDNIINIGDDFILAERTNEANYDLLRYPCRVDAYVAAFCKQGSFKCSINLKEYEIHEGMMLLNLPQYNTRKLVHDIKKYFMTYSDAIEIIIFKGKNEISISRRFALNPRFYFELKKVFEK